MAELPAAFPDLATRRLCALLGIGRSWGYDRARPREPAAEAIARRDAIERIVLAFPGSGYRRVTHALKREGWRVNATRVRRVTGEESLLCQRKRRFVPTTASRHGLGGYPQLLREQAIDRPAQAWAADLTYIRLPTTFCYLAALLDAWSPRVVGWALSAPSETDLAVAALERAIAARDPGAGLIHHADHGVQHAATRYVERLEAIGAQLSPAAVGNVYEHALAESFFATLKREEVDLPDYRSIAEAEANLERFLDDVSNHKRLPSSLGYRPPSEFEALWHSERDDDDFWEGRKTLPLVVVR
jgi:putative transposase